jgi:hypothetical protein
MPVFKIRRYQFLAVSVAWAVTLSVLSLQPERLLLTCLPVKPTHGPVHAVAYGVLSYCLCMFLVFRRHLGFLRRLRGPWLYASAFVMASAWGGFNEIIQRWSVNRTPDWLDLGWDAAGAAFGLLVFRVRQIHSRK